MGRRTQAGWTPEGSGTFGDSFAPLLGLLTVAALAAALDSVRMQREELQLQRRELELTREEMKAQRLAAEAQAAEVKRANELAESSQRIAEKANQLAARDQWIALHQAITNTEQAFSNYGDARYLITGLKDEKQFESLALAATRSLLTRRRNSLSRMLLEVAKDVDLPDETPE